MQWEHYVINPSNVRPTVGGRRISAIESVVAFINHIVSIKRVYIVRKQCTTRNIVQFVIINNHLGYGVWVWLWLKAGLLQRQKKQSIYWQDREVDSIVICNLYPNFGRTKMNTHLSGHNNSRTGKDDPIIINGVLFRWDKRQSNMQSVLTELRAKWRAFSTPIPPRVFIFFAESNVSVVLLDPLKPIMRMHERHKSWNAQIYTYKAA